MAPLMISRRVFFRPIPCRTFLPLTLTISSRRAVPVSPRQQARRADDRGMNRRKIPMDPKISMALIIISKDFLFIVI